MIWYCVSTSLFFEIKDIVVANISSVLVKRIIGMGGNAAIILILDNVHAVNMNATTVEEM